ncbi:hypothetical protein RHO15_09705 [Utexia brackfieldae]|uniref:hypothetical protein n=1 Tax=Utexia brackfieldae TaxID=3074108 RepID=UPI00370D4F33
MSAAKKIVNFSDYRDNKMNNSRQGHFDIYRSLLEADWAVDAFKLACFVRLVGQAAFRPVTVNFNNQEWNLEAGQLVIRVSDLASKLKDRDGKSLSTDAVNRILKFFKSKNMITIDGTRFGTVITILNYSKYQNVATATPTATISATLPANNEGSNNKGSEHEGATLPAIPSETNTAKHEQDINNKTLENNKNTMSSGDDRSGKKVSIDYQAVADAYNEILGDRLPNVKSISDKRKRAIKSFMTKHLAKNSIDSAISYFNAFSSRAKSFYFGDNKTSWIAGFDFVIRESTVIAVREGTISKAEFTE